MKISSRIFKYFAIAGALVMSAAYAQDAHDMCVRNCTQIAQQTADSAKQSIAQQMSESCGRIDDATARGQCFAAVPNAVNQQSQQIYTYVYNSCVNSCGR